MTVELIKCQHCYALLREATIREDPGPLFITNELPVTRIAWLNAENRSPWCLREPCPGNGEVHEIRHVPMPQV